MLVCVREREKERERDTDRQREREKEREDLSSNLGRKKIPITRFYV